MTKKVRIKQKKNRNKGQSITTEKTPVAKTNNNEKPCVYVVLWIPTLTRGSIVDHPIQTTVRRNISGLVNEPFLIEVILRDNHNIGISMLDNSGNCIPLLELTFVQQSDNGLVEYSYMETRLNDSEKGFRFTSECFPEAIYHMIKELYHKHEFHDPEANALLNPFVSKSRINLQNDYNSALLHYLKAFEVSLSNTLFFSRILVDKIRRDYDIHREYKSMEKLRLNAKGMMTYYNTLISSFGQNLSQDGETTTQQKEIQNRIFNLENFMNYFNTIDFELEQRNLKSQIDLANRQIKITNKQVEATNKQVKEAKVSIILTIVLAIAGIVVSWVCYNKSSKDLEFTKSELVETINALKTRLDSYEEINNPNVEVVDNPEAPKLQEQEWWMPNYLPINSKNLRLKSPSCLINN